MSGRSRLSAPKGRSNIGHESLGKGQGQLQEQVSSQTGEVAATKIDIMATSKHGRQEDERTEAQGSKQAHMNGLSSHSPLAASPTAETGSQVADRAESPAVHPKAGDSQGKQELNPQTPLQVAEA